MVPNSNTGSEFALFQSVLFRARRRRKKIESILHFFKIRRQQLLKSSFLIILLILSKRNAGVPIPRSCRRRGQNQGWWRYVWETYTDARFKKTFRVSRNTFSFILERIRPALERKTVVEYPIGPAFRLAICLYRLGTYYHTLSELCGLGLSTVATITTEVSETIVEELWGDCVKKYMPHSEEDFREKILDMEEMWQFPCCWAAIDGCHLPLKCPPS